MWADMEESLYFAGQWTSQSKAVYTTEGVIFEGRYSFLARCLFVYTTISSAALRARAVSLDCIHTLYLAAYRLGVDDKRQTTSQQGRLYCIVRDNLSVQLTFFHFPQLF